jgi:hypothetical protein
MTTTHFAESGGALTTVFAIPMKSRLRCANWPAAELSLRRTIGSIQQAARGHSVVICIACHEPPELGGVGKEGIVVLPVEFPAPSTLLEANRDKARKRRHIGAWVRARATEDVRIAFVDADDLVHRRFLDAVVRSKAESQLVTDGYFVDTARGVVWLRRGMFYRSCGSGFVCRFRPDELPVSSEDLDAPFSHFGNAPDQRGHGEYGDVAADLGRPPLPLGLAGVAYLVNHPESLSLMKRGRRTLDRPSELVWPRAARQIVSDEFSARDLAEGLAGTGLAASVYGGALLRRGRRRLAAIAPSAGRSRGRA